MGFVKTAEEVKRMRDLFTNPRFLLDSIRVEFETSADFVRSVLPPCLQPADEPLALATVSRWQSHACGEFDTSCVFLQARYGDLVGYYNLTMLVSGDMPVTWGRETWGEVKKTGAMGLYHDGKLSYGFGERNGVRLIEIEAEFDRDRGSDQSEFHSFEIKAFPSADGTGLEYDPLLVILQARSAYSSVKEGTGTLTLRGTPHDPLDTIPVVAVRGAGHVNGEAIYKVHQTVPFADREAYLPYFYGRHYDDLGSYPIAARYRRRDRV